MTSPSLPPVLAATAPASAKLEIGGRPSSISPEPSEREPLRSPGSDAAASADSGSSPRQGLRPENAKESRADQAQTQQPHVNDGEGEENSWSLFIYDVFCIFWSLVVSIFFRAINARNVHSIPRTGPVIFVVAPHHNQFIDPLILLKHSPRRVYYLVAAKSMRQKFIGFYGRCLRGIPVERAADLAKLGTGSVRVPDPSQQPTRVVGIGTRFTSELKPNERIAIGNASSRVVSVISDTKLEVQAPGFSNAGEKIVEALSSKAGASFKCIPHLSYDQTYKAVYDRLNHGECVGIFPEGGSHDRTQMLPLKAGVALMALGAMSANPDLNIKIVPTGLNYFHPSKFRSRAVIEFGYPIEVPREMVELYKRGGDGKRRACNELLETISEALKNVTINTPDYETLQLIQAGRRLYRPGNLHLSMNQQVELTRRFVKGYLHYKDRPDVAELRNRVMEYNQALKYYGIRDHQVATMLMGRLQALMLFLWRLLWLTVTGIAALPGTILNIPVFILTSIISKRKAREALAASTVKVRARDVIATWKILIAMGLIPSLYIFYSALWTYIVRRKTYWVPEALRPMADWPRSLTLVISLTAVSLISSWALAFGEQAIDILKSLRPLCLTLVLGQDHSKKLIEFRDELASDITELVNALGPKIYDEFNSNGPAHHQDSRDAAATGSSTAVSANRSEEPGGDGGGQTLRDRFAGARQALHSRLQNEKYSFPPLTPRTKASISQVSPWDFFGADNHIANGDSGNGNGGDNHFSTASARTLPKSEKPRQFKSGLFSRFDWSDTSDLISIPGGGDDDVFFFRDTGDSGAADSRRPSVSEIGSRPSSAYRRSRGNSGSSMLPEASSRNSFNDGLRILGYSPDSHPTSMIHSRNTSSSSLMLPSVVPPLTSLTATISTGSTIVPSSARLDGRGSRHLRSRSHGEDGHSDHSMLSTFSTNASSLPSSSSTSTPSNEGQKGGTTSDACTEKRSSALSLPS